WLTEPHVSRRQFSRDRRGCDGQKYRAAVDESFEYRRHVRPQSFTTSAGTWPPLADRNFCLSCLKYPSTKRSIAEAYPTLGIVQEAQMVASVLDRKFPDTHWRSDAQDRLKDLRLEPAVNEESWISRAFPITESAPH